MSDLDTFTAERLEDFICQPLENGLTRGEQMAVASIALSAKRAEPVAWEVKGILCHSKEEADSYVGEPVQLYDIPQLNSLEIPEGWKLVPISPTDSMVINGFESVAMNSLIEAVLERKGWPYSCRETAECVTGIFKAMLAAAPEKGNG